MTALVTSQAAAQYAPPLSAVPPNPPAALTPLAGSPNTAVQGQAEQTANALTTAKEAIAKTKKAMAENQAEAAVQAYSQALQIGKNIPELANELQGIRQQFYKQGVTPANLDRALAKFQSAATAGNPGTLSAPALLGQAAANANSAQPGAPFNPLRDQAAALTAQAKLALAKGDLNAARQYIDRASSLKVPDDAFGAGQLRPWQVLADVERAEKFKGVATNAPQLPSLAPQGVVQASDIQQAGGTTPAESMVSSGVYQPNSDPTAIAQASSNSSSQGTAPVAGESGESLFRQGMDALVEGKRDKAQQLFSQAWKYQAQMDPQVRNQLKDKLQLMQAANTPQPMNPGEPVTALQEASNEQKAAQQKLFREVTGELAESERMVNDEPLKALDRLQMLRQRVSQSQVDGAYRKQMLSMVDKVLNNVQGYVDQNKSAIELADRNNRIESEMAQDQANNLKVDNEISRMVSQFNELMKKGQFAEAEIVARKVGELSPGSEIAILMYNNATIQRRNQDYETTRSLKESGWVASMSNVDRASIPTDDSKPMQFGEISDWETLSKLRKGRFEDGLRLSQAELDVREKLRSPVAVNFNQRPLNQAVKTLSEMVGVNIIIEDLGLAAEGFRFDQPVTLETSHEVQLKSALDLILKPLNLTYVVDNDYIRITSAQLAKPTKRNVSYPVKDLVLEIPNFVSDYNSGLGGAIRSAYINQGQALMVTNAGKKLGMDLDPSMTQMASIDPNANVLGQPANFPMQMPNNMAGANGVMNGFNPFNNGPPAQGIPQGNPFQSANGRMGGGGAQADFGPLMRLIRQTISPDDWDSNGGDNTMSPFPQNLSLIVSAPQEVHEQIAELLTALRRLQNLQVTIEVRFLTLTDNFFERIGVDFEFGIQDKVRELPPEDGGPSTVIGLTTGLVPTNDLDLRFTQGSFLATPTFGGFDPDSAGRFGFAILSDIELFFLLEAASGDARTNVLQAPKVTMFDGQTATINDFASRPFVIGLTPVVGDFAVAQQPIIVVLNEGTNLSVQSVVTPDKRFVRLTLVPMFTRIENADRTFTFTGSRTTRTGTTILDPNNNQIGRNNEETIVEGSTVQLPTLGQTSVSTTVTVPDGGTVLLGGIKRLREGRTERGIPMLGKLPYINRLFKNVGIGRETSTLMLTVTPRIIIPEEEEEKIMGTVGP